MIDSIVRIPRFRDVKNWAERLDWANRKGSD